MSLSALHVRLSRTQRRCLGFVLWGRAPTAQFAAQCSKKDVCSDCKALWHDPVKLRLFSGSLSRWVTSEILASARRDGVVTLGWKVSGVPRASEQ